MKRRHLTQSQKASIATDAEPLVAAEAKKRQKEHGKTAPGKKKTLPLKVGEVSGKSCDIAGALVGVSGALPMLEKEAKERQREHGKTAPGRKTLPQKIAEVSGEAREKAAATFHTNRQYVSDAKALAPLAKENQRAGGGDRKGKNAKSGSSILTEPIDVRDAAAREAGVSLTRRQCEISDAIWRECSDKEICSELRIAHGTLRVHIGRLMRRLDVRTRGGIGVIWERRERARLAVDQNAYMTTSGNGLK